MTAKWKSWINHQDLRTSAWCSLLSNEWLDAFYSQKSRTCLGVDVNKILSILCDYINRALFLEIEFSG